MAQLDAAAVAEALAEHAGLPMRDILMGWLALSEAGRSNDGEALLEALVNQGCLSFETAQGVRAIASGESHSSPLVGRSGTVRQLADQLRVHALPTLVQQDSRSFAVAPSAQLHSEERPTNRARRILLETRVAVGGRADRGSEQPTRVLLSGAAPRPSGAPTPVTLDGPTANLFSGQASNWVEDKYLVGERIGRGGMGEVHLARDLDLGRDVALKTLPPERRADDTLIRALIHEARLTGQLQHPNIIPVYELGLLSSGRVYYTMKLLSETNLHEVLDLLRQGHEATAGEYTQLRLLNVFQRVCNAMYYAHSRGVLHRDLKPDNILLGGFGEVQVMDWGIATILKRPDLGAFDEPGVVAGTPQYMSPEQAKGDVALLDARSDLYALGVILYEMLTLALPIEIPAHVTEPADVAEFKRSAILPPHRRLPGKVPRELSEICMRALSYDRELRQPDARVFWRDIEQYLEGTREQERLKLRARREVSRGQQAADRFRTFVAELEALDGRVEELERTVSPWAAESERKALWDAKNRRQALRVVIGQSFADAVSYFQRALGNDAQSEDARLALGELYAARVLMADKEGDVASIVHFEGARRELWPERNREKGQLSIRSSPDEIRTYLFRADELGAPLQFDDAHLLGVTPLLRAELPPGSYLLVGRMDGYRDLHQITTVRAGEHLQTMLILSDWSEEIPLVGRVDEMARLRFQQRQLAESGHMRTVLVSGPSGSGKGRIIAAFNRFIGDLPEAYLYLYVHCRENSRYVAFSALAGLLRHRLGASAGDPPERVMGRLLDFVAYALFGAESVRDVPPDDAAEVRRLAGLVARMPELGATAAPTQRTVGQQGLRQILFEATLELFEKLSRRLPLVVVVRSVHFTDGTSRAFFRELMTRLADCPVLLVATTDPAYVKPDLLGASFHEHIAIPPLRLEAVSELLRELLHGNVDAELAKLIHEHTGGHAHAVEDIVRTLVQGRCLHTEGGLIALKPTARTLLVGRYDLRRRIDDRLLALGRPIQEALEAAAVLGFVFSASAVEAMGVVDAEWALQALVDAELVVRQPRALGGEGAEYRFRDTEVRRAVLDLADLDRKVLLHYAAARWIESKGVASDPWKARMAMHLEGMMQPQLAAQLHMELAESALAIGALEDAARNLRQAWTLGTEPAFRARAALGRAEALLALDQPIEATNVLEQLATLAVHCDRAMLQRAQQVADRLGRADLHAAFFI